MDRDHPDQVIDTPVPSGEFVSLAVWEAMRDAAIEAEKEESNG